MTTLIAAPFSPFDAEGELALDVVEQQAEHLVRTGIHGVFICGTTGESSSLTIDERMRLAQRWVEVAADDLRIIVHSGHNCLHDSRALSRHAADIGAHATAALPPCYFKPDSLATLVDCCAETAAAAPGLPYFYYHIPVLSGVNVLMAEFVERAAERISNFAGIKFTHGDLPDYAATCNLAGDRYEVLFGRDEMLLPALSVGARGFVGSTYNYNASLAHDAAAAFAAGRVDEARRDQARINRYIDIMIRFGGLPAGKQMMKLAGVDCGPVRLPLRLLSDEAQTGIRTALEESGFFDLAQSAAMSA